MRTEGLNDIKKNVSAFLRRYYPVQVKGSPRSAGYPAIHRFSAKAPPAFLFSFCTTIAVLRSLVKFFKT